MVCLVSKDWGTVFGPSSFPRSTVKQRHLPPVCTRAGNHFWSTFSFSTTKGQGGDISLKNNGWIMPLAQSLSSFSLQRKRRGQVSLNTLDDFVFIISSGPAESFANTRLRLRLLDLLWLWLRQGPLRLYNRMGSRRHSFTPTWLVRLLFKPTSLRWDSEWISGLYWFALAFNSHPVTQRRCRTLPCHFVLKWL